MCQLSRAEEWAVQRHREALCRTEGRDVAFEEAARDWVSNHAFSWRQRRQAHMLELQRQEILRHKWIESEKARRDLGRDVVLDWIKDHAAKWREWYEQNFEKEADF